MEFPLVLGFEQVCKADTSFLGIDHQNSVRNEKTYREVSIWHPHKLLTLDRQSAFAVAGSAAAPFLPIA
jgi:hypothetical protein